MPRNKDLKRLVRARMSRTGEAYTTARANITRKSRVAAPASAPSESSATPATIVRPADYATVAGMSDSTLEKKTGCTWEGWVEMLDGLGAAKMSHREIAGIVHSKFKVDGWWAQSVTVGYERIKGLRARHQRRGGMYEANKSRTYPVPVATLFDAWSDARVRRKWLNESGAKVRSATSPKAMRLIWTDGVPITVGFIAKGPAKSAVAITHHKLPDRETVARVKDEWAARFDALGEVLANR